MSRYIPKEIVLNNLEIPVGVSILYSTWTIKDKADGTIVHYTARDEVNLTSKIFTDVFEIGKKYDVVMSMVRTDGPTIDTRPLEVQVFSSDETYNLYPMPSVIDTPVITMAYALDNVPTNDIKFTGSAMIVAGNASHDFSNWWLTNDLNEVIWDSLKDQVNKTEIIVSGVDLKKDRFYTMHCVYTGTNRDTSGAGSITFRPNSFDELEISGDMNNTYYGYGIDTRLKDLNTDMTLFEYKLLGDGVELVSNSNTTGEIEINSYYGGEFIGSDLGSTASKYITGVLANNGMVYCAPTYDSKVLKINPTTGETIRIGPDLGVTVAKYYDGVVAPNGMIYFPPSTMGKALKIDPTTDTVSLIGTDYGTGVDKYISAIVAGNGMIYCVPYGPTTTQVLKINPNTDTTSLVGTSLGTGTYKYANGVLAGNGKIYAAPSNTNQVLVLDPSNDTTILIGTDYGTTVAYKYIYGVLASNGKIYYAPYGASKVLEIDPILGTTTLIGIDLGSTNAKYLSSIISSNGRIYSIPYGASKVLEIDPILGTTTLIGIDLGSTNAKYYDAVLASNGIIYCAPYSSNQILEINPTLNTTTQIGPNLGVVISKYNSILSYGSSIILIPYTARKPFKLDLAKYEASKTSFLTESYAEYTLRLRMTTNSSVIGWKDIKFRPKKFKIESDVWDDYNYVYENKVEVLDGKILNYDKSNYNTAFTTPNGNTYQLPNGEIILLRTKTKIGRFNIDEDTGVMTHLGDLYLPQMTLNKDYNVFNFKIFSTGDVLIGVGYTDYTIYHFKYDPVNNRFNYKTKYGIANGGSSTYSEMHLVGNKVVFNTDGNNGSTQDIYIIDLVTMILEQSIVDVVNGVIKGNLVRLDADDFILRGGVKKSNSGELVNSGRLLHVKNANGGVKLIGTDYSYLGLMDMYRLGVLANNGMIYCMPNNASKVLKINPITGVTTLIGIDLGATTEKYQSGVLAGNGMIYCPPSSAGKLLKIDPNTDTVSVVGTDWGATINKWVATPVLAGNGKIYCAPYGATKVLEIDPTTDASIMIGTDYGAVIVDKYTSAVLAPNGKIYCAPYSATTTLEINPTTGVTTLVGTVYGTSPKYSRAILAPNGMIYCTPYISNQVLKINPTTGVTTLIGPDLGAKLYKYIIGAITAAGVIYSAPFGESSRVLKIDTNTDTVSLIGPDLSSTGKYYNIILSSSGKIYGIPYTANKVLEIDPTTDTVSLIGPDYGVTGTSKYWGGTVISTGKIYGVPNTNARVLEIDPSGFTIDTTLDNRINLPTIGISDESALQATLRNNELVLGNFNQFSLKSNSRDEVRLIGTDYGVTGGKYYGGVLGNDGKIYYPPYNASKVLKLDPVTGISTLIGPDLGAGTYKYYYGVLAGNGMIYCPPSSAGKVLKIDPNTDTVSVVGSDLGATAYKWIQPILAPNGKIYCAPNNANQVLMIDPATDTVSIIGTDYGVTGAKWFGSVLGNDGNIYCAPTQTSQVLKIDTTANTTSLIGPNLGAGTYKYYYGVLANNGKIYYPPHYANRALEIDPTTGICTLIGIDYGTGISKYIGAILAPNGKLYCAPYNANQVLMIDPATATTSLVGTDYGVTINKFGWGVLANNGKIYYPPHYANRALEIDPNTDTTTLIGSDLGVTEGKWIQSILAPNGKLYYAPFNMGKVLEIDPMGISSNTFNLKKLPADKNTMTDTGSFIFKTNGGEDFKFTIYLNNGKRLFLSYSKDKPKMILYK